jgi:hypothetical protein
MVVDEIGYLPVSQTGAVLFFQLMSRRYEPASTMMTSNKGFEGRAPNCMSPRRSPLTTPAQTECAEQGA